MMEKLKCMMENYNFYIYETLRMLIKGKSNFTTLREKKKKNQNTINVKHANCNLVLK